MLQFVLLMAVVGSPAADADAALEHRRQFPEAEWGQHIYVSLSSVELEHRPDLVIATQLMVASTSRQPVIERCTLERISPTLLHGDLRDLQWKLSDWQRVVSDYPYQETTWPLVVRADWLLVRLADQTDSDAYFRLLFGGDRIPTKRDDWLRLLGVKLERPQGFDPLRFGLIESESGVAKQDARWIESHPVYGGYAWGTRDVLEVTSESDPLENPNGDFEHDGEEWIVGIPKVSLATGVRGALQVYALSNGAGAIVSEAPVDLVEDSTVFRRQRAVRNPGSCVQCHAVGLNLPSTNDFRQLTADGVNFFAFSQDADAAKLEQQQLEAFHLGDVGRSLARSNEDFQSAVLAVCGVDSKQAVEAFRESVSRYDEPLGLDDTARELGCTSQHWKFALAFASTSLQQLGARLAGLPHGRTVSRSSWEDQYLTSRGLLADWRQRQ